MLRDKLFWLLIFILGINLAVRIYSYWPEYLLKYDPVYWEERYLRSQWVVPDSTEPIGDDGLYAYVGWEYVHGRDPTTLQAETPPLGKYLIGLSILVFKNQNIFALVSGLLALIVFYKLNKLLFKDSVLSLFSVVLFSFEPLFWQQLRAPFLDLLYLLFLLLVFYFFIKERFILATAFLGLMAATKTSIPTFVLVVSATTLSLFFIRKFNLLKRWLFFLPLSLVSFILVYGRYFWLGHSPREFLGVQKWILDFYQTGAKASLGVVWRLMLTGEWITWWGDVTKVGEWQITWPVLLLTMIAFWLLIIYRRRFDNFLLLGVWALVYLLFLSFIPIWPRYLLLLLPFLYNFFVISLVETTSIFKKYRKFDG